MIGASGSPRPGFDRLKRVIDRGVGIDRCWRAVQLHKVKAIDAQIGQAAVDEGFDIGDGIAARHMRAEAPPGLGGDVRPRTAPVAQHIKGSDVVIDIDLGIGRGRATVWTCDLTHGYIDINGSYRS